MYCSMNRPHDVGFGFFDRAVQLFQLLARRGLADRMRSDAVRQFVRENVREECIEAQVGLRRSLENARRNRLQDAFELSFLNVLEHDSLAAFLTDDALVVRKIEGGGADAVRAHRRSEMISFTTLMGAKAPIFGLRYFGSIGRLFSISCSREEKNFTLSVSASSRRVM